jgi:transposase
VTDVSDEEWSFVVPYLTLIRLDSEQREHDLRAVFNALRWLVRSGAHWRMMPHDFPPWAAVYQQMQRWLRAGCFEAMVHDLRVLCPRRLNFDHLCRLNFDQGSEAVRVAVGCG